MFGGASSTSEIPDGDIFTSRRARVSAFEVCRINDVVLLEESPGQLVVGQIWFFFSCCDMVAATISLWPTVSTNASEGAVEVRMQEDMVCMRLAKEIVCATTYRRRDNGRALILVPCSYRDYV